MTSISFIVAIVGLVVLVLICLAAIVGSWLVIRAEPGLGWMAMVFSVLCLAAVLAGFGYGLYPYDMEYHSYRPIEGTASEDVDSRFLGAGDGTSENFLVTFPGGQYRCDDTRCARIKAGDHVKLSCIREWNYGGTDGDVCRFVEVKR